jgi:hypothetical protein
MRGRCMSKRPLRFWQYQPTADQVPMWVAIHCTFNEGKTVAETPKITVNCTGEEWTLDPGDFVVERPGGQPYVLSAHEFEQMFEICPEQAAR